MQINPINNNRQTFKACYKVPFTWEGYHKLMGVLKEEGMQNAVAIYGKANRYAKDIAVFRNPFPYEHLYNEELISVLLNNNSVTEEEAAKYGIKFNIFHSARVSREVQCEILNSRLDNVRNKGIDVDSVFQGGKYIYVTTCDDTEALKKAMGKKLEAHFKECFGERKELEPIEALNALAHFYPGPKFPKAEPKRNFIQRLFGKDNKQKEITSLYQQYEDFLSSLNNKDLNENDLEIIQRKMDEIQEKIDAATEPRYVKNARFLVEQFNQEKERFKKIFFDNREVTPVGSVEELLEKL